jgi:serine/threonine protein kinase
VKVGREKASVQELQALQAIWHPNIISVDETFVESGLTFIVLEYCPSGAVSDLLLNGPLSPDQLSGTTHQIVSAPQAAMRRRSRVVI